MALVLIFTYTFSVWANDVCHPDKKKNEVRDLIENVTFISNKLEKPWGSASDADVKKRYCKRKVPSTKEIIKELYKDQNPKEVEINGISLFDDPKLIESLNQIINSKESLLFKDSAVKTDLSGDKFKRCKKVICITQKIFGIKNGTQILYLMHKFGMNASHLLDKNTRAWSENELDPYLNSVIELPDYMLPINSNRAFVHDKEEKGSTMANSTMTFFAGLDSESNQFKQKTCTHEFAHYIASELEIDNDPEWLALSGWKVDLVKKFEIEQKYKKTQTRTLSSQSILNSSNSLTQTGQNIFGGNSSYSLNTSNLFNTNLQTDFTKSMVEINVFNNAMIPQNRDNIISQYGERNPAEDFAESLNAYRYNPKRLKEISPKKYDFIKNRVYFGQEFISKNCHDSTSRMSKMMSDFKQWKIDKKKEGDNLDLKKEFLEELKYKNTFLNEAFLIYKSSIR